MVSHHTNWQRLNDPFGHSLYPRARVCLHESERVSVTVEAHTMDMREEQCEQARAFSNAIISRAPVVVCRAAFERLLAEDHIETESELMACQNCRLPHSFPYTTTQRMFCGAVCVCERERSVGFLLPCR